MSLVARLSGNFFDQLIKMRASPLSVLRCSFEIDH